MAAKKKQAKQRELSEKQRRFAEVYDGNGTQAARAAGYSGSDNVLAQTARDLLTNPQVAALIRAREDKKLAPQIMGREERQAFWSTVARADGESMRDRLRATELLGKSNADFIERHEHSVNATLETLIREARASSSPAASMPSLPDERDGSGGRSPESVRSPPNFQPLPEAEEKTDGAEHRPDVPAEDAERAGEGEGEEDS